MVSIDKEGVAIKKVAIGRELKGQFMKAYGINFVHRRPSICELVAKDYTQFMLFAAMCAAAGVARYVRGVFFDTKWQGFDVDVDPAVAGGATSDAIRRCAMVTLHQFNLSGEDTVWAKQESPGPATPDEASEDWS